MYGLGMCAHNPRMTPIVPHIHRSVYIIIRSLTLIRGFLLTAVFRSYDEPVIKGIVANNMVVQGEEGKVVC
jgi:hypothetical protein